MTYVHPDPLAFTPPSPATLDRLLTVQRAWFPPVLLGLENIPDDDQRLLFVGNHTLWGVLDTPLLVAELWRERGLYLRGLGDHAHFVVPGWRNLVTHFGALDGTPENCRKVMQAGQPLLVFPGGGREALKNAGETYQLRWRGRTGFARLAMEHGYRIMPFAAIGMDEAYSILYDANAFRSSLLGRSLDRFGLLKKTLRGGDFFPPICRGIGLSWIPRPEKCYFRFGETIDAAAFSDRTDDAEAQWHVASRTEHAIEGLLAQLQQDRVADQDWPWWRKKLVKRSGA